MSFESLSINPFSSILDSGSDLNLVASENSVAQVASDNVGADEKHSFDLLSHEVFPTEMKTPPPPLHPVSRVRNWTVSHRHRRETTIMKNTRVENINRDHLPHSEIVLCPRKKRIKFLFESANCTMSEMNLPFSSLSMKATPHSSSSSSSSSSSVASISREKTVSFPWIIDRRLIARRQFNCDILYNFEIWHGTNFNKVESGKIFVANQLELIIHEKIACFERVFQSIMNDLSSCVRRCEEESFADLNDCCSVMVLDSFLRGKHVKIPNDVVLKRNLPFFSLPFDQNFQHSIQHTNSVRMKGRVFPSISSRIRERPWNRELCSSCSEMDMHFEEYRKLLFENDKLVSPLRTRSRSPEAFSSEYSQELNSDLNLLLDVFKTFQNVCISMEKIRKISFDPVAYMTSPQFSTSFHIIQELLCLCSFFHNVFFRHHNISGKKWFDECCFDVPFENWKIQAKYWIMFEKIPMKHTSRREKGGKLATSTGETTTVIIPSLPETRTKKRKQDRLIFESKKTQRSFFAFSTKNGKRGQFVRSVDKSRSRLASRTKRPSIEKWKRRAISFSCVLTSWKKKWDRLKQKKMKKEKKNHLKMRKDEKAEVKENDEEEEDESRTSSSSMFSPSQFPNTEKLLLLLAFLRSLRSFEYYFNFKFRCLFLFFLNRFPDISWAVILYVMFSLWQSELSYPFIIFFSLSKFSFSEAISDIVQRKKKNMSFYSQSETYLPEIRSPPFSSSPVEKKQPFISSSSFSSSASATPSSSDDRAVVSPIPKRIKLFSHPQSPISLHEHGNQPPIPLSPTSDRQKCKFCSFPLEHLKKMWNWLEVDSRNCGQLSTENPHLKFVCQECRLDLSQFNKDILFLTTAMSGISGPLQANNENFSSPLSRESDKWEKSFTGSKSFRNLDLSNKMSLFIDRILKDIIEENESFRESNQLADAMGWFPRKF